MRAQHKATAIATAIAVSAFAVRGNAAAAAPPSVPATLASRVHIPITVEPLGIGAAARRVEPGEVVTAGIPFAPEDSLRDVTALRMQGASAAQFRCLERDPHSGFVTWALATFTADGGPYAVTAAASSSPSPSPSPSSSSSPSPGATGMVREFADSLVVDTGAARFTLRRRFFNGIDRVVAGGTERARAHAGGGVVAVVGGTRFESALDSLSRVGIEDDGAARAVLRADGTLRAADGRTSLRYTVRLHFDRNTAACRLFVTLRNADFATQESQRFDAAWFEIPLGLTGPREVRFGFPGDGYAATLAPGARAQLYQADNTHLRHARTTSLLPYLGTDVGLAVAFDGIAYNTLGARGDVAEGWVRVDDGAHAVLAGMRDFAALFPAGFDVRGDCLAIDLFARQNAMRDLVFAWGAHETRELLFEWGPSASDPDTFANRLQRPALGRCEFSRYRDSGAFSGERRLVSVEETTQFFADQGYTWQPPQLEPRKLALVRRYSYGTTGGPNQFDQDECLLLEYARGGNAGAFLQARLSVLRKADQAVVHSDDFDHGILRNGIDRIRADDTPTFHGRGAGNTFDDEHPHWVSMVHYYHLTGDEHVRDAIADYGEWRRYRSGNPLHGARFGGALHHMRLWSRCLRDLAVLYRTLGDHRDLNDLRTMATALVTTIERDGSRGRNLERGYFYFGNPLDPKRRIHLFFLTEMNALAVHEAMRVLPASDPLREELRDYLTGLAWFTLQEAQVLPTARGYPYGYFAGAVNSKTGTRGDQTAPLLVHGYETTGDEAFIARARALAWRVVQDSHRLRASEPATHAGIYRWLHRDDTSALLIAPRVERHDDGSATLAWRSPPGAAEVVVKYGHKRLVETLDFDPVRRAFGVDSATAMPFWAARNLAGEPAPLAAGELQTWRTPPLPPGDWFFAVKILGDGRLRGSGTPVAPGSSNRGAASGVQAP